MEQSFFRSSVASPYHLSVGVILYNEKKEIACHYFKKLFAKDEQRDLEDFYILMHETVEKKESLEAAALRGLREEFDMKGEIQRFLGAQLSKFPRGSTWVEKTTVYFLAKYEGQNGNGRDANDDESISEIQWRPVDYLIEKMEEQGRRWERSDLNEAEILKRAKVYLEK